MSAVRRLGQALRLGLVAIWILLASGRPAAADNCQTFTDCFATADAGSDALLGLTFLGMLSMAINFVPYVGTAKGVVEAVAGRDLLTGEQLSTTDRLLGLVPGGLGRASDLGSLGRVADGADGMAALGRSSRYSDDIADATRATRHGDDIGDSSRAYHVGEDNIARHGPGPFENTMADDLADDLARADAAGIRPITPADGGFDALINGDEPLKWAVTLDGELRVMPHTVSGHGEMPHSALTRGEPVLAAGEATIAGSRGGYFGLDITPHSGHFRPSLESLDVAREAFARYGITFP